MALILNAVRGEKMNVNLTPHLEEWIQRKIESGGYNNASEVVREALRLMEERDQEREAKLAWLRQAIQEGVDSGPSEPLEDIEVLLKLAREYRAANSQQFTKGS